MDGKAKIRAYRERLNKTLACHDLMDQGALKDLVRNNLLKSLQHEDEAEIRSFLDNRTKVISNFLDMLRSVSGKDPEISKSRETSREWKVKQDNEDYRVMYREGPPGTLFHDLLVEGYIDGPIDVALCVSNQTPLYKCWFPQYTIPTFRIISSECLHRVRIGEQIGSLQTKISWPISSRECLLHYIEFEFFQDDLIVVVINSISGPDGVDKSTHGIPKEMIPAEENGMVRMGVVGGFALQKVTNGRCYFRTIGTMDLKLDYVPTWLVNFMARQLIGSGFKLYKKAVSTCANNEKFQEALQDPLYVRVREALLSDKEDNLSVEPEQHPSLSTVHEGNLKCDVGDIDMQQAIVNDGKTGECSPDRSLVAPNTPPVLDWKVACEIEEEMSEERVVSSDESDKGLSRPLPEQLQNKTQACEQKNVLRPEVTEALITLDKVIRMVRELGMNSRMNPQRGVSNENSMNTNNTAEEDTSKDDELSLKDLVLTGNSKEVTWKQTSSGSRRSSSISSSRTLRSSSSTKEVSRYAVAPASSPELEMQNQIQTNHAITHNETTTVAPGIGRMTASDQKNDTITTVQKVKQRNIRFCCK